MVKEQIVINSISCYLANLPHWVSYVLYFAVPVLFTFLSLLLSNKLADDNIEAEEGKSAIKDIEQANNAYLPSYLGYFFDLYCQHLFYYQSFLFEL